MIRAMAERFYSDRAGAPVARTKTELDERSWQGIRSVFFSLVSRNFFADRFRLLCDDGKGPYATDVIRLYDRLDSVIPDLQRNLDAIPLPATETALDLVDFACDLASEPSRRDSHPFYGHDHLKFSPRRGRATARQEFEQVLARNGLAFTVGDQGVVERLLSPVMSPAVEHLAEAETGDDHLDALLHAAAAKATSRTPGDRQAALEKLWGAFERVKAARLPDSNKRVSADQLLDDIADSETGQLREALGRESLELTGLGNSLGIRHQEGTQQPVTDPAVADWLFTRCAALVLLMLNHFARG